MQEMTGRIKGSKLWLAALAAVIVLAVAAVYGVSTIFGGADQAGPSASGQQTSAPNHLQAREVRVNGRLVFPRRLELTFDTSGEVGEILVRPGQRVEAGQILASLDAVTVSGLEQAVAQAQLNLDRAKDALEETREEFVNTPLEQAAFEEKIAAAGVALDNAEEALDDFNRDHAKTLATARETRAKAEEAVDNAQEALDDFQRNHATALAKAREIKARAEVTLDDAEEKLGQFERDQGLDLAQARKKVADSEVVLDKAREDLADFDIDYIDELTRAADDVANKQILLQGARKAFEGFITNLGVTRSFNQEAEDPNGGITVVDDLTRLEVRVERARADLRKSEDALAELREGPDLLKLEDLKTAVAVAETNLVKAKDDLAREAKGLDLLVLGNREAAVAVAGATLAQAEKDLAKLAKGPDEFKLRQLEAAVELAQASLAQAEIDLMEEEEGPDPVGLALKKSRLAKAREDLIDLTDGPDPYEVQVKEAEVASAQAKLDDAIEDLEGSLVRAAFDGVVSLINAELDDLVNKESRIVELTDPGIVEVHGLVDAVDVAFVKPGAKARVTIAALQNTPLDGTVSTVAAEPRTERGVVSYAVNIRVRTPEGVEVPLGLSAVSAVVIYEGDSVS